MISQEGVVDPTFRTRVLDLHSQTSQDKILQDKWTLKEEAHSKGLIEEDNKIKECIKTLEEVIMINRDMLGQWTKDSMTQETSMLTHAKGHKCTLARDIQTDKHQGTIQREATTQTQDSFQTNTGTGVPHLQASKATQAILIQTRR